jgi:hypothetical protein
MIFGRQHIVWSELAGNLAVSFSLSTCNPSIIHRQLRITRVCFVYHGAVLA